MRILSIPVLLVVVANVYSYPQFITVKDGKLGVNFGGYHAAVALGGLLGGGAEGGLFAEAGTPHGQAARAGLGGVVSSDGRTAGGLYAGATAGGNVKAEAGLAGGVGADRTAGTGFASAQAGGHDAAAGLGGETSGAGSVGYTFSGTKSIGVPTTIIKETEVSAVPIETTKYKSVQKEFNIDAANEINAGVEANFGANVQTDVQPAVIVKEVSRRKPNSVYYASQLPNVNFQEIISSLFRVPPQGHKQQYWWMTPKKSVKVTQVYVEPPTKVVEKHIVRSKPHHHHVHKTAFIGGYIGADAGVEAPPKTVVYESVQPVVQKRVDVGTQASANVGAGVDAVAHGSGGGQVTYTKEVTIGRNPDFFKNIFNIPIATLTAVSNLLTNTAKNVSIQKTATVQAESDSPKHASSYITEGQISVQTPSASQIIGDIFAIPINTLGAVNKFLENNVPVRKRIQVSQTEGAEPTRVRLGPLARRRANKQVINVQEIVEPTEKTTQ